MSKIKNPVVLDTTNGLMPCPFCGGKAHQLTIEEDDDPHFGGDVITCTECGASSHVEFGFKENLKSAWNSRTAMPQGKVETVYPDALPCAVELKPGFILGKGCKTETLLIALQRRADYYAEIDAMTPEQRAEHDAGIAAFKEMLDNNDRASMLQAGNDSTTGKPLTITLPDITSKAFWSGTGKSETFHSETYKRWVKEAIERACAIASIEVRVK